MQKRIFLNRSNKIQKMKKVKQGIKKIGTKFNIVGEEVKFEVSSGFSKPPSLCATILSIIGIVAVSVIGYEFVRQSFDKTRPNISIELKTLPTYPKVDLEKEKFYFIIVALAEGVTPLAVEGSRYTVTAQLSLKLGDFTQRDPTKITTFKTIKLESTRCSNVIDQFDYFRKAEAYNPFLLRGAHCFYPADDVRDQYWVKGQIMDSFYSTFDIKVWPCSLDDPTQCAPPQLINGHKFLLVYPTPDIDYSKIDNFLGWIGLADTVFDLSTTVSQKFAYTFKHFEVFDQNDVFSNPKKKERVFCCSELDWD